MIVRNKYSGECMILPDGAYEVGDAFIVPLQCLYKTDYELVNYNPKKKKEKA